MWFSWRCILLRTSWEADNFCYPHLPWGTRPMTLSLSQLPETKARGSTLEDRHGCCRLELAWVCSPGRANAARPPPFGKASSGHTGFSGSAGPLHMTCCTRSIHLASNLEWKTKLLPLKLRLWLIASKALIAKGEPPDESLRSILGPIRVIHTNYSSIDSEAYTNVVQL